jgi:CelD/BcsL family acetyltransferase involved in cellulose biosynthesis
MTSSGSLEVYCSWDEIDDPSFVEEWKGMMERDSGAHVFYHPVPVGNWMAAYRSCADITPVFCVARIDGARIFLPLVLWKRSWKNAFMRLLVPAGFSEFDYHDPLVDGTRTPAIMAAFRDLLEKRLFDGRRVRFDRIDLPGFRMPLSGAWMESPEVCPYVDLRSYRDYPEYLSKINKGLRQDIGRQKRRLGELGQISYRVFSGRETDEALKLLPEFLEVHSRKWSGGFKAPGFHEGLVKQGLPAGIVHFSAVMLGETPISWHLGFKYRGRFYYYMPTYLEKFATYSPSKVHLSFMKEEGFSGGVEIFDYLRGGEAYKHGWAGDVARLYDFSLDADRISTKVKLEGYERIQTMKKMISRRSEA